MVKKTYLKSLFSIFKEQISTFIAFIMIIAVGVGFSAGIGTVPQILENTLDKYYRESGAPDAIYYFGNTPLEDDTAEKLRASENVAQILPFTQYEFKDGEINTRIIFMDFSKELPLEVLSGSISAQYAAAEQNSDIINNPNQGEAFSFMGREIVVGAIVKSPFILCKYFEPYLDTNENISRVIYLDSSTFRMAPNAVYVNFKDCEKYSYFTEKYKKSVQNDVNLLKNNKIIETEPVYFTDTASFMMLENYINKVRVLSSAFPVFFIAVSVLSVFSGISRIVTKERPLIAALKIIGYQSRHIALKYFIFAMAAAILGSLMGMFGGPYALGFLIYKTFETNFFLPAFQLKIYANFGFAASMLTVLSVFFAVLAAVRGIVKLSPAQLLYADAPKPGKKILLEKIPFIWRRLKFKYKSSFRNIFRFVKNLLLTVLSITGSTMLVFAGFSLKNTSDIMQKAATHGMGNIYSSMSGISFLIILSAGLLSVLVVYNLANINIEQRKKEIASLKVLGYTDKEVGGYIFRELFIMSAMGAVLGLVCGYFFVEAVFNYIEFGNVTDINWLTWLITPLLIFVFTFAANLLLYKKIKKTDMNSSLKSND